MNVVIGSGPAGVAAAAALLDRGEPVTMIDAGGDLEPEIQSRVAGLARRPVEQWTAADRDGVRGPLRYNAEGAPLKLAFGSDYVYRDVEALQPVVARGVDAYRAFAAGGLSVLWGAAVLPYSDADLDGWPVSAADLARHYVSALEMTGLAADDDGLSALYPLYIAPTTRLETSAQARFVLERMAHHAGDLERQHVRFGKARLAITGPTPAGGACVHCGLCLYGCPYGLIYSTRTTLRTRLAASDRFTYVPGRIVRRVTERGRGVTIDAVSRDTGAAEPFEAARVYLAAGAVPTTAILLESLQAGGQAVTLAQSEHFLLPLLMRGFRGRAAAERLHTLSQVFMEVNDPAISRHGVHLQLYTYNDFYARMVQHRLGPLYRVAAPVVERVVDRIVLLKGYLHSDDSSGIRATLGAAGSPLRLDAVPNPQARRAIGRIASLMQRNSRRIGASPLRIGLRVGLPGSGVHVGGGFPMRRDPRGLECDVLGRPAGLTRVHVVDSTVFPTLPAAPPTLTIMANAHRIASWAEGREETFACSG